jgi:hypothetical protein
MEFMSNFQTADPSHEDILEFGYSLIPMMNEIGVEPQEADLLMSYLRKNLDSIRGPEDFIQGMT